MQFKYFAFAVISGIGFLSIGCNYNHPHNPDGSHPYAPDGPHIQTEIENISYTNRSDLFELFLEFSPLIMGEESDFIVHFTDMNSFQAIQSGKVIISALDDKKNVLEKKQISLSSPGIFKGSLATNSMAVKSIEIEIESSNVSDRFIIPNITVYEDQEEAIKSNPVNNEANEISYLKEQAWNTEFAIEKIKRQSIHEVIRTSGEIQAVKSAEKIVSAKNSGIVHYKNLKILEGREVRRGEVLFSINSQGLIESNIEEKYLIAKARLTKAKSDYNRAEKLISQEIIGQKEYENRKLELAVAEAEWKTLAKSNNGSGQAVYASMSGFYKEPYGE